MAGVVTSLSPAVEFLSGLCPALYMGFVIQSVLKQVSSTIISRQNFPGPEAVFGDLCGQSLQAIKFLLWSNEVNDGNAKMSPV